MKRKNFIIISLSLALNSSLISAPSKGGTYTDPSKVDADYAIQGEYAGEVQGGKAGAQIIALGDGKFDVVGYPGGLPGAVTATRTSAPGSARRLTAIKGRPDQGQYPVCALA